MRLIFLCLFIDPGMERDHVLSTWSRRTTHWTLNRILINRSFVLTSSRKSYLFHSLNLEACSSLIEWDRTDIVERWIDTDQWSTHRSEDDKTICEERALIDDLFFWTSSIIFIRDEIRDHLPGFSLYLTQIFTFISLPSLPAARERIGFKRSILLNLVSTKFVPPRSQGTPDPCKPPNPCKIPRKPLNPYNDVRFWTTGSIRRTTDHNHKQKERRSEERIFHAKDNNLKET
jgi:hypothetical protein